MALIFAKQRWQDDLAQAAQLTALVSPFRILIVGLVARSSQRFLTRILAGNSGGTA